MTHQEFTAALTAQFPDRTWTPPRSHHDALEAHSGELETFLYVAHFPGDPKPWLVESGPIAGEGTTLSAAWQTYLEELNK